jgi:hypothetical protein
MSGRRIDFKGQYTYRCLLFFEQICLQIRASGACKSTTVVSPVEVTGQGSARRDVALQAWNNRQRKLDRII